jgi:N-methylhydantoinase A
LAFIQRESTNRMTRPSARLAIDIGGTFTDLVLEHGGERTEAKVLTTPQEPERGVLDGVRLVLDRARLRSSDIGAVIHGTTLATNAIIERKGARCALVTTAGFRDSVEMAYENRFDQYDVFIDKPEPLVPRYLRFGIAERMDVHGKIRIPLDTDAIAPLAETLKRERVESIAVGFLHSYANAAHEQKAADLLAKALPGITITLSSDICPEAREYERFSTACANAYVQPRMARYLAGLRARFAEIALDCPLMLMTSGGALTTLDTAMRWPIRLVESGPAGGAILAAHIARAKKLDHVVSFDMGGTTAKICLIDDGEPQAARQFEVDRRYRFLKGSGLPIRIPVVEMVEIGAGGGSIASLDTLQRIAVGPESAGADPGPACYGQGGEAPTVTDADLLLGRIDADAFAGGRIRLDTEAAISALEETIARPLGLDAVTAAFGVSEMVEEAMANAARVHAVERGKELGGRTLIAFGGGAPLHAARLAEKLGIPSVLIPAGAGVGSAIGFLRAPVAFELARSRIMRLSDFDGDAIDAMFAAMETEAVQAVRLGAPGAAITQSRTAEMRYVGQGHEIVVPLPVGSFTPEDLRTRFEASYTMLFGRIIPGLDLEAVSWTLRAAADRPTEPAVSSAALMPSAPKPDGVRRLFDTAAGAFATVDVYQRRDLSAGARIAGPAIIAEDATTTIVTAAFTADIEPDGAIRLNRKGERP